VQRGSGGWDELKSGDAGGVRGGVREATHDCLRAERERDGEWAGFEVRGNGQVASLRCAGC